MVAITRQQTPDLKHVADPRGVRYQQEFYRELVPAVRHLKEILARGEGNYDALIRSVRHEGVSVVEYHATPKRLRDVVGPYLAQEFGQYIAGHVAVRERVSSPSEKDPFVS